MILYRGEYTYSYYVHSTHITHVLFQLITHIDHLPLRLLILSCCFMAQVVHSLFNHSLSIVVQAPPFYILPIKTAQTAANIFTYTLTHQHFKFYIWAPKLGIVGSVPTFLPEHAYIANWMVERPHLNLLQLAFAFSQ